MRSTRLIAVCALALALGAASCGGGGGATSAASPPPAASAAPRTVDPNFDFGQTVLITRAGFRPRWLVSLVGKTIVWRNDSNVAQSVVFDHEQVRSGLIPPGGSYTYHPSAAISLTYHSGVDPHLRGAVQVTPPGSS